MSLIISPLDLLLDTQNPRFVILASREQADIRKYLVTYEDVCQLASAINDYGSLLPGERIVVLQENDEYVVIEGNRRTCSLQFLLSRNLIPDGFAHRIPPTSASIIENCQKIEIDVLPNRDAALELMTKRHIEGVKQWKPLAKKQFFAANYKDGQGQSVQNLSKITGIKEGEIKEDIRDYKFFFSTYEKYCAIHPDFSKEIIVLKTDPFWRIFKAKFEYPTGNKVSPAGFLKITYDDKYNTVSDLPASLFERITQLVFEKAIVTEEINTRNILTDVDGIVPLLKQVADNPDEKPPSSDGTPQDNSDDEQPHSGTQGDTSGETSTPPDIGDSSTGDSGKTSGSSGGPMPGGPPPRSFFEAISWHDKLYLSNQQHQGLLIAINELYSFSTMRCGGQKAYKVFPVATGMILRTAYEQALRLRLMQVNLWSPFLSTLKTGRGNPLPTLSSMENYISQNKQAVFPDQNMILIYDRVVAAAHRDFLNANIHYPGNISVTSDSLEAIAAAGMHALIQGIINLT